MSDTNIVNLEEANIEQNQESSEKIEQTAITINCDDFDPRDYKKYVMENNNQEDTMEKLLKNREIHYNLDNFSTIVFHKGHKEWKFPLNEFFDKLMKWMKEN